MLLILIKIVFIYLLSMYQLSIYPSIYLLIYQSIYEVQEN